MCAILLLLIAISLTKCKSASPHSDSSSKKTTLTPDQKVRAGNDELDLCKALLSQGIRDTASVVLSRSNFNMSRSTICDSRYSRYEAAQQLQESGGLDIPGIFGVDAGSTSASSQYEERWSRYCGSDYNVISSNDDLRTYASNASTALLNSFDHCIDDLSERFIRYINPAPDGGGFTVVLQNRTNGIATFNLTGLDILDTTASPSVFLSARDNCQVKNHALNIPEPSGQTNELTITCKKPKDHSVTVTAHVDKGGNIDSVIVPESPQAGPTIAERVQMLESASAQLLGQFHVGTIVPFSGSMADAESQVRYGWWVCDNRVVSDPQSAAYNGKRTPDLSGRFLRAGSAGGDVGGMEAITIQDKTVTSYSTPKLDGPVIHGDPFTHLQGTNGWNDDHAITSQGTWTGFSAKIIPPYYSVIYLIKVR